MKLSDHTIVCLKDKILKLHANKDVCSKTQDGSASYRWADKDKLQQNRVLNFPFFPIFPSDNKCDLSTPDSYESIIPGKVEKAKKFGDLKMT